MDSVNKKIRYFDKKKLIKITELLYVVVETLKSIILQYMITYFRTLPQLRQSYRTRPAHCKIYFF